VLRALSRDPEKMRSTGIDDQPTRDPRVSAAAS
jgi:hypothetical protein